MKSLLKYLNHYKKESIIGPLFKLFEACLELLVPVIMAQIIDVGIESGNYTYIYQRAIVLIAFGVVGLFCSLTAQYFAAKASVGFGTQLREALYSYINCFSYSDLDSVGSATLITRMTSDINQVQSGVNLVLRLFLRSPFIVLGAFLASFYINSRIALLFLITIPVLSLIIYGIMKVCIPIYKRVQEQLDAISKKVRENLSGVRVIRAFSRQSEEKKEFDRENQELLEMQARVGRVSALMNPLTYVVVNLAIIAVIWYGGVEVNRGMLTQGEVIALVNYMTQILLALIAMSILITSFTKATACAARVEEVFHRKLAEEQADKDTIGNEGKQEQADKDTIGNETKQGSYAKMQGTMVCNQSELHQPKQTTSPVVEFRNVSFSYQGSKGEALSDLNFSVAFGETIGIIGGTGSGKSTLVQMIPRFYQATKGTVYVDDKNVCAYQKEDLRRRIGIVPQRAVLFAGTIRENLMFGNREATEEDLLWALDIAQAMDFVMNSLGGLDALVLQGGKNLSGGQKQRLTIARALVLRPDILILDDSASALDYATDAALKKAIAQNTKNMTVFIVSQRAVSIKDANRILVLEDGKIAGYDTHAQLLQFCELYQEICKSQKTGTESRKEPA